MAIINQGAIKTLMASLREWLVPLGIAVRFGEESVSDDDAYLPMVTVYPVGGPFQPGVGYAKDTSGDIAELGLDNLWIIREQFALVLWASQDPNANPTPTAEDNAVAIENLRRNVLCAFQAQAATGLFFVPQGGQWQLFEGQQSRYGRGYVMNVQADITYTTDLPVEVTVTSVVITPQIEGS